MKLFSCPLCTNKNSVLFYVDPLSKKNKTKKTPRTFHQCTSCHLVFVPQSYHLTAEAEKAEYEQHDNVFSDVGYHVFLAKATEQVIQHLSLRTLKGKHLANTDVLALPEQLTNLFSQYSKVIGQPQELSAELALQFLNYVTPLSFSPPTNLGIAKQNNQTIKSQANSSSTLNILDFGCGPMPVLGAQLSYLGCSVAVYDKYFYPDTAVLSEQYDVITCTEVIEHIWQAATVWEQFKGLLKPDGMLLIMTKRVINEARFAQWHYKNDSTHICFYHEKTARYLAHKYGWTVSFPTSDIMLFRAT
jgi:hypothetical protein